MQKPLFKIGLENRSAAFALSASYIATMILRKSVTHTGKKIRILVRCSYSITAKDADFFIHIIRGENPQKRRLPPDLVSIGLYAQDGTQFRGHLLPPLRTELSSGAAFSSGAELSFEVSAFSYRGGTQFRGLLLPPLRAELSSGGAAFSSGAELSSGANCFLIWMTELSSASPSPDCSRNTALRAVSFAPFRKRVQGDAKTP